MTQEIIVKTRDDKEPIRFKLANGDQRKPSLTEADNKYSLVKENGNISREELRSRIEPWLTALFQSEHFSLLVGTGLTYAVNDLAKNQQPPTPTFTHFQEQIINVAKEPGKQNGTATLERQLNVANELVSGLKHLEEYKEKVSTLEKEISNFLRDFSEYILKLEQSISRPENADIFNCLISFLTSFASRAGTRDRLQIFTTNYDRVIEIGSEIAGLHLLDRFVGNLSPIFRSSRLNIDMHYNPPGIRGEPRYLEGVAHFSKLHGSVDWIHAGKDIRRIGLPFGASTVEPYLKDHGVKENIFNKLMIYPNAAKDKETTSYPYVELFRDFSASICRPNNSLVTYGYGFGDDHINRNIEDMLTIPSTHLVVISHDDPGGRIMNFYGEIKRPAQITLLIGETFGDLKSLVTHYLPKSAIDRITFRMADLLKSRLNTKQEKSDDGEEGNEK